jgi:hypothetical protein
VTSPAVKRSAPSRSYRLPPLGPVLAPDLSAKVRLRMRRDRNPVLVTVQDKFAVRDYAHHRRVACAPLLHCTEDASTIPFATLPADCMIKATHGSGWNILREGGRHYLWGKEQAAAKCRASAVLSEGEVITSCRRWLASRYSRREWAYNHIRPRIIVEELLRPRVGHELFDIRMYTFDGRVRAINIGSPGYRLHGNNVFLWPDWSLIPLTRSNEPLPSALPERPDTLGEMIRAAERLGDGLGFVRVDLYDSSRGVLLGEMTVYPDAGARGKPSGCSELDRWLGLQWTMGPSDTTLAAGLNCVEWIADVCIGAVRRACRLARPIR